MATTTTTTRNDDLAQKVGISAIRRAATPVLSAVGSGLGPIGAFGMGIAADVARPMLNKGIKNGAIKPLGASLGAFAGYATTKGQPTWVRLLAAFTGGSIGNFVEKKIRSFKTPSLTTTTTTTTNDDEILQQIKTNSDTQSDNLSVQDILNSNYNSFDMSEDLFGLIFGYRPADPFHVATYGSAGSGKSTLAVKYADYFAKNFGKVKFLSSEMGTGDGLKKLLKRAGVTSTKIKIDARPKMKSIDDHIKDLKDGKYKLLVVDSVNHLRWDSEDLERIKKEIPKLSTFVILQSVKEGTFKGSNELAHNADILLKVDDLNVYTEKTRFEKKSLASVPINY